MKDIQIWAGFAIAALAAGGLAWFAFLQPRVQLSDLDPNNVLVTAPVTLTTKGQVDTSRLSITVSPHVDTTISRQKRSVVITANPRWSPAQQYTIQVSGSGVSWAGNFHTQPRVAVSAVLVGTQPTKSNSLVPLTTKSLTLVFTEPMKPASVTVVRDDAPIAGYMWSADFASVAFSIGPLVPYRATSFVIAPGATSDLGYPLTDDFLFWLRPMALEPSNGTSGITADFRIVAPTAIVVDNAGPSHPQAGLQGADIVFEYISEHGITRFTVVNFAQPPAAIGNTRSCRMINLYLGFAFRAVTLCSGASDGTLYHLIGEAGGPRLPSELDDFDSGAHAYFYRSPARFAPYNLFTDGARAQQVRELLNVGDQAYTVDPAHEDHVVGTAAADPAVGLHWATYQFDPGSNQYLRFDRGTPLIDSNTGVQVHVKNVVIVHTDWHDGGWPEDSGGAHSVWYDLLGSGPAEIYSNGSVVSGIWHMGDRSQQYYENGQPIWFSDASGKPLELNTGLTWIHVVGNGQT